MLSANNLLSSSIVIFFSFTFDISFKKVGCISKLKRNIFQPNRHKAVVNDVTFSRFIDQLVVKQFL